MSTYSEIIEEQQFHDRVKYATREVLTCIENGELDPVVAALKNHPLPKFIKFDEVVAQAVGQKDVAIFDAVMDYIAQNTLKVSYNKYLRQSMICACENNFVHALSWNPEWRQHITPSFYLHLLQSSAQYDSPECLNFVLSCPHTLKSNQWMDLVGESITHICPQTLDILLKLPLDIEEKDRLWVLSFLAAEHLTPLQHVMFDHFALKDILLYTPLHRHEEIAHLYDAHSAQRAEEQKNRIESLMVSNHRLKERKL